MQPLDTQPALIDRAYERLVAAIASGTLAAGRRIRQEELAAMLGVSRQPISHALQLLKRQGLVEEAGKRGLIVCGIDAARIRELYQVRTALDALAARLAAARIAEGTAGVAERREAQQALAAGLALGPQDPVAAFIDADVAFHTSISPCSVQTSGRCSGSSSTAPIERLICGHCAATVSSSARLPESR